MNLSKSLNSCKMPRERLLSSAYTLSFVDEDVLPSSSSKVTPCLRWKAFYLSR